MQTAQLIDTASRLTNFEYNDKIKILVIKVITANLYTEKPEF